MDAGLASQSDGRFNLVLDLHFNYQILPIKGGALSFGIRGGELRLSLSGMQLDTFLIKSDFNWHVEKRTKVSQGSSDTKKQVLTVEASASEASANVKAGGTEEKTTSGSIGSEAETEYQVWQVSALQGSAPGWRFLLKESGENYLVGNIIDRPFATIKSTGHPTRLTASFTTEPRYLAIEITDGFAWKEGPRDIRRYRIANLYLWHKVIKPIIVPYMSRVELREESGLDD
jgi:hypothetical protein